MAVENQLTIVGNLTDDPELRYTPNGAAVAKFRVAVSRRVKDDATGQWKDADTSFFSVNAWRSLGENAAESLTRGTRVVVTGRLLQRSWETQEGDKRTVIEIEADEVAPSLRWATAKVER
ncbi:MAG: single-stranded DNA-binding protein, partial [Actinomycetota bacterium]